ncbi:uncharacterized protein LOC127806213 [Diospyros lotus]|uniref:uncharacterized protein LOC127806213 n=1 Tax=Diospyros lotus TaxID=55363 RepID=UPI0022501FFB|nr:uncharacterized protein LOC127806213 [Diospyros lotus]
MSEISRTKPVALLVEASTLHSNGELQNMNPLYQLDGRNYLQWSQIVKTFLKGRGKISHLNGSDPSNEDLKFQAWDEEDSMIMSWFWNSMQPEISKYYMFLTTAKAGWDTVQKTYSKMQDAVGLYEIKTKISAGLNVEFDQIWVQILGKEKLPSLSEVYSMAKERKAKE